METTVTKRKKLACGATIFLSMALTVLMCCLTTPDDTTISAMQVRNPILGVLWAVATALAVYLNLNYLRKKCGVENTCFQIFVIIGSAAVLLTPFTMSESPIGFSLPFMNLHRLSALVFAIVTYVALTTLLFAGRNRHKIIYPVFSGVLLIVGLVNVYGIFAPSSYTYISALMETCLVLVGLTVLFLVNFLLDDPAQQKSGEKIDAKSGRRLSAAAISIALLIALICGIAAIPAYHVTRTDTVYSVPVIPANGYQEIKEEYFSICLPEAWQQRKYSNIVNYYDDVDRNSYSLTYTKEVRFETITQFHIIQNAHVKSSEVVSYMGHDMLITEIADGDAITYTYRFNCDGKGISIALTFTGETGNTPDDIFRSINIYQ